MLTIEELRNTLPDKGKDLSDEQIRKISNDMYQLADIIFDKWLAERNAKKEASVQDQISPSPEKPSQSSPSKTSRRRTQ